MENDPLPFPITTSRLVIRQAVRSDMRHWSSLYRSPKVRKHLNGPLKRSAEAWWNGQKQVLSSIDQPLTIILKATDEFVGVCGYFRGHERDEWEAWLILRVKFWKKGIGFEVTSSLIKVAFQSLGAKRVVGIVDPSNQDSLKMMKKLGFTFISIYSGSSSWQQGHQIHGIQNPYA